MAGFYSAGSEANARRRCVDRVQKEELVSSLNGVFASASLVVVTRPSGLTVAESTDLRRQMMESGASFKVTKNRLTRLALKGTKFESLSDLFVGPTAIAFSDDPIAAAKVAVKYAEGNDKFEIIGGGLYEEMLDDAGVKSLAKLPSLDELRGKIIGILSAPATRIAGVLQAPGGQLARVMQARASQGEIAEAA
ncbi:MAG: large subunit ribosomal protein L10 [Alphaproteobacteria bacterium]|jgi:large subunit ribosomal protein L10